MKTFNLTLLTLVISMLVVATAFADPIAEWKKSKKNNKECNTALASATNKVDALLFIEEVEEEPMFETAAVYSMIKNKDQIAVKVFDAKGNLLDEKMVTMHELMSTNYAINKLPENSVFLMYYDNTAYYIVH
jgi:exonuclease VII small subunit